ncbi:hypothetical protein DP939_27710 [Spongiactinospora rosea]|uniref:Uncharacterized protein n=1 Tax=Spongiactinospora rosea TaxID=2248750 RepID=A0A366LSX6_9ACTN|nr:hypothetical protein [Spongiactinospora rosea]RBQ16857.1 hypothetical protein DP939_27710 [Spongiactinospora rosea]
MTDDADQAEKAMLEALEGFPQGRGRVQRVRLSAFGNAYEYGETVIAAHREDGGPITITHEWW